MSNLLIGIIGLCILLILLFAGMHIGLAMGMVGFFGLMYIKMQTGYPIDKAFMFTLGLLQNGPFASCSKESLVVIPMFTLMGIVCYYAGISQQLYATCYKWVSRVSGGLAIGTTIACAFFGAICGSATATTASMGKICLPEMDRYNYKRTLSCGAISAGGTLGLLIPPSTGFMLYGINSGVGVGKMFIAGILPGIVLTICYAIVIIVICRVDPVVGPKGENFTLNEKLKALLGIFPVMVLFVLVLGSILLGWCSVTEGGAFGAFGAIMLLIAKGKFTIKNMAGALRETMETTAMIFIIMIGSDILGQFFSMTGLSQMLGNFATSYGMNRWIVLIICLLVYGLLGCFVDSLPLIVLLTPIFLPVVRLMGFDEMWFGVLMVMLMQLGLMTPPVGMCCYVMAGIAPETSLQEIFKGTAPFLVGITVAIIVVMLFPALSTWLPGLMG